MFTLRPATLAPEHLDSLREAGLSEPQVTDVIGLCAYRHFNTRIADGVGIALDDMLKRDPALVQAYSYPDPGPSRTHSPAPRARSVGAWLGQSTAKDSLVDRLSHRPACAAAIASLWDRAIEGGFAIGVARSAAITSRVGELIGSPFPAPPTDPGPLPSPLKDLVERLTSDQARVDDALIDAARTVSESDEAVLETVAIVAAANAIGRIANATGFGPPLA